MSGWYDESQRLVHLLDEKVSGLLEAERDEDQPGRRSMIDTLGDALLTIEETCDVLEVLRGQLRAALGRQLDALPDRQRKKVAAAVGVQFSPGGEVWKYEIEKFKAHLAAHLADELGGEDLPPGVLLKLGVDAAFSVSGVTESAPLRAGASADHGIYDLSEFRRTEGSRPPSARPVKLRR